MRVVHLLRKYDPAEWGGTETAVHRLLTGLRRKDVSPVLYCPRVASLSKEDDVSVKRFNACVPVWGLSAQQKRQHLAVGGNLMSFDLLPALWRESDAAIIHTHTLGRLGGIASTVARARGLPFVVSIHGGLMDAPPDVSRDAARLSHRGIEWGKVFGVLLRSRRLIEHSDAVFVYNDVEARMLQAKHPDKRIETQFHGIETAAYEPDYRLAAREAFPQIKGREVLLCAGRIDPVKNQAWVIEQFPEVLRHHPKALLVLAGACTNEDYGHAVQTKILELGLSQHVLETGGLPPGDPRLIGLFQEACALLLPSLAETFGLVLLEAWAAGTAVVSSRTSGALAMVKHGENGWLFSIAEPRAFHEAIGQTLQNPELRAQLIASGNNLVRTQYDLTAVAGRTKQIYQELIEAKDALRIAA